MTTTKTCYYCPETVTKTPDGWWSDDTGYDCPARWIQNPVTGEFVTNHGHAPSRAAA